MGDIPVFVQSSSDTALYENRNVSHYGDGVNQLSA